ncbi:MAG: hypothetical protein K9N62_18490 [Verrucomicrobia bacterium]|nr:hypothetical protein [Verrucomicrobiota bacterium]
MKSHVYQVDRRTLAWAILQPILWVCGFGLVLQAGTRFGALPPPTPTLDADRTILVNKAVASRAPGSAEVVLIGDSSCMMDVSARGLGEALPGRPQVLNLGTLSFLDLPAMATLVRRYEEANPGRMKTLVLLMHPEALRRPGPSEYHVEVLRRFFAGSDFCSPIGFRPICWLGREVFHGRIWSRLVANPIQGNLSVRYRFTSDLDRELRREAGSLIDPGVFNGALVRGNAEYRLANTLEAACGIFKSALPNGARLVVGMTPAPEGFVAPDFAATHARMLAQLARWLEADASLDSLPATLPDSAFASVTHLNEVGREAYTTALARALAE